MDNKLLDIMRIANREFQEFISQVAESGAKAVESRGAIRRLEKVNLRLNQVSKCLGGRSKSSWQAPEVAYAALKYGETLRELRSAIGTLQLSLLTEKAHLENVRANLQAACSWAASLREIS